MSDPVRAVLARQLDTAWALARHHMGGLSTAEMLWRPAPRGPHVHASPDGRWRADWPDHEGYDLGPPSIAWVAWHIGFWWSMALDHAFGEGMLVREDVLLPPTADAACAWIGGLADAWRAALAELTTEDLRSTERTRWPFRDRPFGDVVAWVNVELTKNAAEIGYARFLYGARGGGEG